jgi:diguanylate cyclase (GGDEF)-like protein/PAS domain S-box-containing protein
MDKRLTPARIALLYAAFASLWIFASDKLLVLALPNPSLLLRISMFKGFAFVLITTWLLYLLMKTLTTKVVYADSSSAKKNRVFKPGNLLAIFLGLALIVPLFGFGIAKIYTPRIQQAAFDDLSAIATLKAAQVETWLKERRDDADELGERAGFVQTAEKWLKNADPDAKLFLLARMDMLDRTHGYEPVLLRLDGRRAMTLHSVPEPVTDKVWNDLLKSALSSGKPQHSDLYRDDKGKIRLDYVVPLHLQDPQRTVGAVVLRAPAEQFLFPLIQSWPTASPSAETVLARRDGDQVLFLNELRHRKDTALSLRLPLDTPELAAASSILTGKPQTMEGIDYRNIRVMAATRPIQGTNWHLVAKVDRAEVMALLNEMLLWVSLVAIIVVMVVASAVLMLWRQQQRLHQMALTARTAEKDKQLKLFYDLPFLGMAITSPTSKAWLYANDHLCDMLGYSHEELLRTTWADLTHADDLALNEAYFERMNTGEIDGYTLEKRFIRKDGSPLTVNLDVKCTRTIDGKINHLVAMIEDITEHKHAEQALRKSEATFRSLFDNMLNGVSHNRMIFRDGAAVDYEYIAVNRAFEQISGMKNVVGRKISEIIPGYCEDNPESLEVFGKVAQTGQPTRWEHYLAAVGKWFSFSIYSPAAGEFVAVSEDITVRKQAETLLIKSEQDLREAQEIGGFGSYDYDIVNDRWTSSAVMDKIFGIDTSYKRDATGWGGIIHPSQRDEMLAYLRIIFEQHLSFNKEYRIIRPNDGEERWVLGLGKVIYSSDGVPLRMTGTIQDITERKHAEESLRKAATVFESSHDEAIITDLDGNILAANRSFVETTGYSEAELLGQNPRLIKSGRHGRDFFQMMWASVIEAGFWQGEIWNRRKNGEVYPARLTISAVKNVQNVTTHYVGISSDLSQLKQSETQLEHLAHYDPLTDLPNRLLINSHLSHALSQGQRHHTQVGVLYLDLDRFKNVNDSLGYPVGDELLVTLTERLTMHMRSEDMLARLGGDEFLLVLEHIDGPDDAATVARSLLELLAQPFVLSGNQEIFIGASIGISVFPNDGSNADQLIQYADAAMHQAKQVGRNTYLFYTEALTRASGKHLEMETRLRHAITANQLRVYYQPQVDIATGRIIGAEALVRWLDPERGLISPVNFIPLAEESGLIGIIGEWVLKQACLQGKCWVESGLPFKTLAVNLSPHQFQRGSIVDVVSKILAETGFPADRLELELTESALMQQEENAVKMLHLLRAQGVRLAIDDFGTGYSSLAYLKRFPLDVLKIDKSFVDDIPFHQDDMEIAATIIAMGHSLGFKVLAEGVETEEQLAFLQMKGCDMYQGYLTSPPVPAEEFETMLRKI